MDYRLLTIDYGLTYSLITNIRFKKVKYTNHNLKKIQGLLEELGYIVRYEKGNFQSGYCLVENRNIAIVNKFYDTEGRINVLLDILSKVGTDVDSLSEGSAKLFKKLILQPNKEEEVEVEEAEKESEEESEEKKTS